MIFRRNRVADPNPKASASPTAAPAEIGNAECARKDILLVEDDPVVTRALSMKLESRGYRVIPARDGAEAIVAARRKRPDLMLMDVHLPTADVGGVSWDGFALAQWMRRLDETKNLPLIMMTGTARPDHNRRANAVGARAFLTKPINSDALLSSIENALDAPTLPPDKVSDSQEGNIPSSNPISLAVKKNTSDSSGNTTIFTGAL